MAELGMAELQGLRGERFISAMTSFVSLTTGTKSVEAEIIGRILSKAFLPLTDLFNDSMPAHVYERYNLLNNLPMIYKKVSLQIYGCVFGALCTVSAGGSLSTTFQEGWSQCVLASELCG
jgi:hypothetical protein